MDIDLLAKMVKEVILDHDAVTLPGVGSFVAELVPASFADKGYTIHPPYRRLYFSPRQGSDTLLTDLYARSNNVSDSDATRILVEFLTEMKEVLKVRKTIVFPGLGRLRATRENHFFFVADEDLDIYPAGFGLAPISLKTHEETKEEVEEAVTSLADMLATPAPAEEEPAAAAPAPIIEVPAKEDAPAPVEEGAASEEPVEEVAPAPNVGMEEPLAEEEHMAGMEEPGAVEGPASVVAVPDLEEGPAPLEEIQEQTAAEEEPEELVILADDQPDPALAPAAEAVVPEEPVTVVQEVPIATLSAVPMAEMPEGSAANGLEELKAKESAVPERKKPGFWAVCLRVFVILLIIAVVLLIALAVVGRVAPEWLDSFLYSADELEILHN
ncbi:MAG: hypothetical protein IJ651_05430 [Bacteroidales bacterium]|nr:hypothetical protein [Bacteroidales bacterium]